MKIDHFRSKSWTRHYFRVTLYTIKNNFPGKIITKQRHILPPRCRSSLSASACPARPVPSSPLSLPPKPAASAWPTRPWSTTRPPLRPSPPRAPCAPAPPSARRPAANRSAAASASAPAAARRTASCRRWPCGRSRPARTCWPTPTGTSTRAWTAAPSAGGAEGRSRTKVRSGAGPRVGPPGCKRQICTAGPKGPPFLC